MAKTTPGIGRPDVAAYLDHVEQGLCIFDAGLDLVVANAAFRELLGYPESLCRPGTPLIDFIAFDCARGLHAGQTPEAVCAAYRAEIAAVPTAQFQARIGRGKVLEFARHTAPDGASVCTFTNITGIHNAAEALERDSAIIRHLSDAVAVTDLDRIVVYHNPAYSEMFERPPHLAAGAPLAAPADAEAFFSAMDAAVTERGRFEFETEMALPSGRLIVARGVAVPRKDTSANHVGYIALFRDVTEQAHDQQRLMRQDHVIAQLAEGVVIADHEGHVVDCNAAAELLFGYSREEILGKRLMPILFDRDAPGYPAMEEVLELVLGKRRWSGELPLRAKSGERRLSDCTIQPFYDEQGRHVGFIGVHRDVTARRAAEEALRRQALVMEHMSEAVVVTDAQGRIEECNPSAKRLFDLGDAGPPPAMLRQFADIAAAVAGRGRFEGMYDFEAASRQVFCDAVAVPLAGREGTPLRIVSVHRDITDRVRQQREQERLQEQMRSWRRLETLGRLAGGIAHDFNNMLTPVIGYAHLARKQLADGSQVHSDIGRVIEGMEDARQMVQQILTFGQRVDPPRRPVLFDRTIDSALDILCGAIPRSVVIERSYGCDGASILANSTQLHQLVMNLCANAVQAMPAGGRIRVRTDRGGEWQAVRRDYGLSEGPHLRLAVEDQGCGIAVEDLERIFDPFFSTKGGGKGTGLGLSVVHGVVRTHRGGIRVFSKPGEGTRFEIYLPEAQREEAPAAPSGASAKGRGQHILVVDDDAQVRDMIVRMLEEQGYRTSAAGEGEEALAKIAAAGRLPDLVLTDRAMPGMDGQKLAQRLASLHPALPVVLMSGMIDARTVREHRDWGISQLLAKPILPNDLAAVVDKALQKSAGRPARKEKQRGES